MSQLLDMAFSPDDTILIGGDEPDALEHRGRGHAPGRGGPPPRSDQRNLEELDALLGSDEGRSASA